MLLAATDPQKFPTILWIIIAVAVALVLAGFLSMLLGLRRRRDGDLNYEFNWGD